MFLRVILINAVILIFTGGTLTMADVADKFSEHEIVSDVVKTAPGARISISYGSKDVDLGNELTPAETAHKPNHITWECEQGQHYTLIMTDPDAPSRTNPKAREWRHWVVVNIPCNDLSSGNTLTEYSGPTPPPRTGLHRYVFLVYKQSGTLSDSGLGNDNRGKWSASKFAAKHNLGNPVAGNFMQVGGPAGIFASCLKM